MKCKYGQNGACEKLFRPNCPDSSECYEFELYTNADHLRAMSDKELAEFLTEEQYRIADIVFQRCGFGLEKQVIYARRLEWLQQPAKEDT